MCITCARYETTRGSSITAIVSSAAFSFYWGAAFTDTTTGAFLFLMMTPVVTFAAIALHEIGHALAGIAVGGRIVALSFGSGKRIKAVRRHGRFYLFGWRPVDGMTLIDRVPGAAYRWRMAAVYFAGPLVNLVVAMPAVLYLRTIGMEIDGLGDAFAVLWAFVNLLMFAGNLFPFRTTSGYGEVRSDGRQLLDIFRVDDETIESGRENEPLVEAYFEWLYGDLERAANLLDPFLTKRPVRPELAITASAVLIESGRTDKAQTLCEEVLETEEMDPDVRALLQNNLAYSFLLQEDPALLPRIGELSEAAFVAIPMILAVRGTRGEYLLKEGRHGEAIELLEDKRFSIEKPSIQANVACNLALAYIGLGLIDDAQSAFSRAKKADPSCAKITLVESALAQPSQ